MTRTRNRDDRNGQFAYDGKFERLCICGHTLGVHAVGGFDCLAGTNCLDDPHPGKHCDCQKFRQSRRKMVSAAKASR